MIRVSFPLFLYFIFLLFYVIINFYKNYIIIIIFFFFMKIIFICPCSDRFYRRSLECGKREKKHAPVQGVSTSVWKSPLELKEWFCTVDLNLKKMKLMMQTHL